MPKVLFLEITCCSQCPYFEYDFYYDMHTDSGFDCNHDDGRRIIDEGELNALKDHDGPKLTAGVIPDWCPLPDRSDVADVGQEILWRLFLGR